MSELLKLKNQLCHRFYTASNAFTRAYRPLLSALDLTYPQYIVMLALWEKDKISIAELLGVTRIDGGAMTLILKKLEAKGFIRVQPGEKDKRVREICLTEEGANLKADAHDVPARLLCQVDAISEEEARTLISLIDKLSDNLNRVTCNMAEGDKL